MFWGLILKANKKYTQTLEKPFHLSQAALDHSSSDNEPIQVMYSHEDSSYLLCTLQKGVITQCALDLNFAEGDKLCFLTKGNGIVHLTGFLIPEEEGLDYGDLDDESEEEEEEEEVETPDLRQKLNKNKGDDKKKDKKKVPVQESSEDEDDDEDGSEQEIDTSALNDGDEDDSEEGDSDDDDMDEDEDEDESDEEEEISPPKAKQAKLDPQQSKKDKKQQNGVANGQEKKKNKENQQQPEKQKAGQIQKMQGGLQIQDLKVGNGAEAKVGKKIQVYYEGRLKANNKTFDATKSGPGFKMTLGRGEVIKGWDIGLVGMKVGGKRRLICPPQLAYGHKGNPPVIPANSTLVFDVELKNVL